MALPRMRTIKECAAYFFERDNQTSINACMLRKMVISGEVPCIKVGKKYLINLDNLIDQLEQVGLKTGGDQDAE